MIAYIPVSGDNTASLNAATTAAIAAGQGLLLPTGVIELSGTWFWPSDFTVVGAGQDLTVIHKTAGTDSATLVAISGTLANPVHDIHVSDFTIDGNAVNQTCPQFYNVGGSYVRNLLLERVTVKGFYNGGFVLGPEGYEPTVPNGEQINYNITIRSCRFDGSNQKVALNNGDLLDLIWINGLVFEQNTVINSSANGLSLEFNQNAIIRGNTIINCWRSIYMETSQHCLVYGNDTSGTITGTPVSGDCPMIGIWLVDANQSYPNGGYGGCSDISVIGNKIHDLKRSSGSSGVYGIRVCGPQGQPATAIDVSGNTISNLPATNGITIGISLEGDVSQIMIWNNVSSQVAMGYFPCGGAYNGYSRMTNVALLNNDAEGCYWAMYSANGSNTSSGFTCSGNKFIGSANGGSNVNGGGYDVGMRTMPGFLAGNNQGF